MESIGHLQSILTVRVNEDFSVPAGEIDSKASVVEKDGLYYVIVDGTVVPVTLKQSASTREYTCLIDQQIYEVKLHRVIDGLVQSMGYDLIISRSFEAVTAPMPGLVKKVHVSVGETVIKGQSLVTLEAMKMENIIKSPNEGTIKAIAAEVGKAVEKNEILLTF
jgi:biotin carboxyl carrier protein